MNSYPRAWLKSDVLAGISVAAIQIPTAIAYAQLAGFPPQVGLYASILPLVAYMLLGSSRQLILGPDSATCAVVAATLFPLAGDNPTRYVDYSVVLAVLVGLLSLAGGAARLGFIADFLARPILTGFLNGIGLSIIVGQLGKLIGVRLESKAFLSQIWEFATRLGETHALTLAIGLGLVVVLIALKRLAPKVPGPLAGVVLGGLLVFLFDLSARGVGIVGDVPAGLPTLRVPSVEAKDWEALAMGALGIALLSYCSAMLTARSFAARNHYDIDASREFIALGAANIAAGLSQGFVISGADSRTAVNDAVGGKSRLTGLFAAAATAAALLFLTWPLRYIPSAALAAVLIMAGIGLIDVAALKKLRAIAPFEFRLSIAATLGVLVIGVLPGIVIAVLLALIKLLSVASRPGHALLGSVPGDEGFHHDVALHPESRMVPGLIIFRFDASPLFFNADHFKRRVRAAVASAPVPPRWFLYSAEAANIMDVTGSEALEEIRAELAAQGIVFAVARGRGLFEAAFVRSGLAERVGPDRIFPSVRSGVQAYLAASGLRDHLASGR